MGGVVVGVALLGYAFIFMVMLYQLNVACVRYRFELRMTHGKRRLYVRSRATGRIIGQCPGLWDVLILGIE